MSTLNVGDRVHLKWDHSVTGKVTSEFCDGRMVNVTPTEYLPNGWCLYTFKSWWERIPEPLQELVPIEVLEDVLEACTRRYSLNWQGFFAALRERGYGRNDG